MMIMIASAIVLGGQWAGTHAWTGESGPAPQRRSAAARARVW